MAASFVEYLHLVSEEYVYELLSIDNSGAGCDVVNLRVFPDVPSEPVFDIRESEDLRIVFDLRQGKEPAVEVCRENFPSLAHVNPQFDAQSPKSICLFAEPWQDRRPFWNNGDFLARIFMWFQDAAEGKLHRDDQAIEPIFWDSLYKVILPSKALKSLEDKGGGVFNYNFSRFESDGKVFLVPHCDAHENKIPVKIMRANAREQIHGQLQSHPQNLGELLNFLDCAADGFMDLLIDNVKSATKADKDIFMLFVQFPVKRAANDSVERVDQWLFLFPKSLYEIGEDLGVIGSAKGVSEVSVLVGRSKPSEEDLTRIIIAPLTIIEDLSRKNAQNYGGVNDPDHKVMMIGSGAIGSQVNLNLNRVGWGEWVVVDHDHLLPHNIVRHASDQAWVGCSKAQVACMKASWITSDCEHEAINCDVLNPGDKGSKLRDSYGEVEIILDCSASVAVARHISRDIESDARRVSAFIGAGMNSLVFLGEDKERKSPLDWLEMLMYRESLVAESVSKAIVSNSEFVRYGGSCRDRSVKLAQDMVAVMAGLASRALRRYASNSQADIRIYNIETNDSISCSSIKVSEPMLAEAGDWQVVWDAVLIERMERLRRNLLPDETGGVLLGSRDTQRKILYVVDVLPEPDDSKASEKEFVRGVAKLEHDLEMVGKKTAGGLEYVGEWHSHPDGCSAIPSSTDCAALAVLRQKAELADIPVLMAIIAASGEHSFSIVS